MAVEREQRIKEDTSTAKRNLYCDVRLIPVVNLHYSPFILETLQSHSFLCCTCLRLALNSCHAAQTCHKQYKSAAELDTHLSSYDHHHKKVNGM